MGCKFGKNTIQKVAKSIVNFFSNNISAGKAPVKHDMAIAIGRGYIISVIANTIVAAG